MLVTRGLALARALRGQDKRPVSGPTAGATAKTALCRGANRMSRGAVSWHAASCAVPEAVCPHGRPILVPSHAHHFPVPQHAQMQLQPGVTALQCLARPSQRTTIAPPSTRHHAADLRHFEKHVTRRDRLCKRLASDGTALAPRLCKAAFEAVGRRCLARVSQQYLIRQLGTGAAPG